MSPLTFSVGIAASDAHGGGHLEIAPGSLIARPGPLGRRYSGVSEVRHQSDSVSVRRGWFFVRFAIDDETNSVTVSVPKTRWRSVRSALQDAGFEAR